MRVPITALQYVQLRDEKADPKFKVTRRQRVEFIIGSTPYSIDIYKHLYGEETTCVMRFANPKHEDPAGLIPPFVTAIADVRSDPKYTLKAIASA